MAVKTFLSILLSLLMLLPLLISCGEAPADVPATSPVSGTEDSPGTEPATEPVSEPETDPFDGAEPLPEDLVIPSCLKTADGSLLGTIVLPGAAKEDAVLAFAAQDLQYHLKLVLGADFAIVSRPGEGYGSIILATPDSLPAVTEMFADDIAWLADLGSKETGRWGKDGFAIRQVGDDIWIIGNVAKGAMNCVYDLIEDNLGVLWYRADETKGLVYDELEEATVAKVDYREKSPFSARGCLYGGEYTNGLLLTRNKSNTRVGSPEFGGEPWGAGHTIFSLLLNSPSYDPEETEYWETDDQGNSLGREGSHQVNPWSDKVADVIADSVIARMKVSGTRYVFVGEADAALPLRNYPYDEQPFEYAPGQFVQPEDDNYYSTVFHTMINKIARKVKEEIPDGRIGTFAYSIANAPPACDMEDNIQICYAPYGENYCCPILDPAIAEYGKEGGARVPVQYIPVWAEKVDSIVFWHYYTCNAFGTEYGWPIWYRIQADLQDYIKLGVIDGVATDGLGDLDQSSSWITYN